MAVPFDDRNNGGNDDHRYNKLASQHDPHEWALWVGTEILENLYSDLQFVGVEGGQA